MTKITATFFLGIYLFASTEAHQLLKLPKVFEHFAEHQQEDKGITFLHFLAIHYTQGSPKDKDYDKDMQLPFKTSSHCSIAITNVFVPLMTSFSITKPVEVLKKKNYLLQNQFLISSYLANIWQPPKHC